MEFVNGVKEKRVLDIREVLEGEYEGKEIRMNGAVHTTRHMGEVAFVILRKSRGLVQCVYEAGITDFDIRELKEESAVEVMGVVKAEERAPQGFEIRLKEIRVLSRPAEPLPLAVSKWKLNTSLEAKLSLRPISLRNVRERAKFKIQEGIVRGFRDYLLSRDFTEIRTPKIVARGAEGGSNVFKLEYFNKKAELGQSPQFYKQTMVGVYDRVFEAAPVFRAEKHNTTRHLNEYTSLDFEMGYIDSMYDVMAMETACLRYVMEYLKKHYAYELELLEADVPVIKEIPCVTLLEAKEILGNKGSKNKLDLEPEDEVAICEYAKKTFDSDFIFVTHFPSSKPPFYAMNSREDSRLAYKFDLLFRGLEITSGGQRIHDYQEQLDKMHAQGLDPEDFKYYLEAHKYGLPPHGGLGIGLERLVMKLLGLSNVRQASMFPRDINRLLP